MSQRGPYSKPLFTLVCLSALRRESRVRFQGLANSSSSNYDHLFGIVLGRSLKKISGINQIDWIDKIILVFVKASMAYANRSILLFSKLLEGCLAFCLLFQSVKHFRNRLYQDVYRRESPRDLLLPSFQGSFKSFFISFFSQFFLFFYYFCFNSQVVFPQNSLYILIFMALWF